VISVSFKFLNKFFCKHLYFCTSPFFGRASIQNQEFGFIKLKILGFIIIIIFHVRELITLCLN
jgi:hypothetical protein